MKKKTKLVCKYTVTLGSKITLCIEYNEFKTLATPLSTFDSKLLQRHEWKMFFLIIWQIKRHKNYLKKGRNFFSKYLFLFLRKNILNFFQKLYCKYFFWIEQKKVFFRILFFSKNFLSEKNSTFFGVFFSIWPKSISRKIKSEASLISDWKM